MKKKSSNKKKNTPKKTEPEITLQESAPVPSIFKTLWGLKWTMLWAFLVFSVQGIRFKEKDIDEENNFYFRYYFKQRYYSPTFWILMLIVMLYSLVMEGVPGLIDNIKTNFNSEDDDEIYTTSGKFTDSHMKTFPPIRKFFDFIMLYGTV